MPLYEFFHDEKRHGGCGHRWEEQLSIQERMIPFNKPCPKCGKKGGICRDLRVNLHKGIMNPKKHMPGEFKEQMERIHAEHPDAQSSHF